MTDIQNRIAALSAEQRALLESRVANLAATRGAAQREPIQPRDRVRPTPLSFAQQREWALERFRPSNNIIGALRLEGDVDLELLGRVMTEVTVRHEVLRSTVEMVDRTPVQVVHPVTPVPVGVVDLSHLNHDQQRAEMRRHYDAEVMRPFPQDQAQRLRATVLRLAPTTYIALLIVHHASSDGWSTAIIIRDAAEQYRALRIGKEAKLPPLPIQYGDFAAWQREHLGDDRIQSDLKYWKEELADIPPRLELPTDRPHPVRRTFDASQHAVSMPREDAITLQRFARDEGVSLSMLLLAAASAMLYRYTGQDDLVLGSAISGRSHTETEQLIGCFANALPLRMKVSRTQTLRELLHQARDVSSAAFAHQDVPFDLLIDELAPKETSQTPLIQMMINVVTSPGNFFRSVGQAMEMPNVRITVEPVELGPVAVDLILIVQASAEAVEVQWHYSTELFDAQTVVRLAEQFDHVRKQIVSNPDRLVGDVDLLDTGAPVDTVRTVRPEETSQELIELFQHQVVLAPDAPAVICDGAATSYGELNQQANRLARQLQAFGVTADTPVAILLDRSPRLATAILGVLKAGGAYVPVDPAFPAERISFMICDAAAPVLITTEKLAPLADGASRALTVLMDSLDQQPADGAADPPVAPRPFSTAYVVYTSGSTGRPKGVMIERRSLVAFAREVAARLQLGAGDRFLQFASPSFDVLAEELFPIWLTGGAVVFPPQQKGGAAIDLAAIAERDRVSVMELPAAYWHEWVRELNRTQRTLPPSLRLVIVGAGRVLPERLAMWQQLGLPLMHVYGITETTVSSTFFRLAPDSPGADRQHLPIGTALPSARLRILDSEFRPVPAGAVGELYIGGNSLARGYLGRPGMTAERFVADPDPAHPGERAYRTGDLVRRRVDGNLEFLSRADAQIKIRGFRVEPTEIESAICRHPQIAEAAVTVRETAPDDRRLIAYLVPQARTRPNITDMRRFLAREIPHYLVPAAFVTIDKLPLTPNGKVDFDRLPEPPDERPELDEELVPPRTPLERQLAGIVAAVLGITLVGANDNFFELGGDSILAIQVAAHAQEEGIPLSPLDLFEHPTIALLAELAAGKETADATDQPADATDQPADATHQPGDGTGQADGTGLPDAASSAPAPADFPLARVDQAQLDTLLSSIAAANADKEA
jgi:amino acid adenylation domain-containing protein